MLYTRTEAETYVKGLGPVTADMEERMSERVVKFIRQFDPEFLTHVFEPVCIIAGEWLDLIHEDDNEKLANACLNFMYEGASDAT